MTGGQPSQHKSKRRPETGDPLWTEEAERAWRQAERLHRSRRAMEFGHDEEPCWCCCRDCIDIPTKMWEPVLAKGEEFPPCPPELKTR